MMINYISKMFIGFSKINSLVVIQNTSVFKRLVVPNNVVSVFPFFKFITSSFLRNNMYILIQVIFIFLFVLMGNI